MMKDIGIINDYNHRKEVSFSPYDDNGGSIVAVAGENFAVIGSDTRLSTGYSIFSREQTKLVQLTDKTILGSTGCWADAIQLIKKLKVQLQMYQHTHNKDMTTTGVAQLLSTTLYYKRFFPYSLSNVLAGLDNEGKGCVFGYDPIGHCERATCKAGGSSGALLQPLLDNQVELNNMENVEKTPISLEKAVMIVKDVFISAAERDIYTGDAIHIYIVTKDGSKSERFELRKD